MIAVASTTAIGAASSWTAIQSPMCNGTGCGPSVPHGPGERRTPRATGFDVQPRLREGGRRSAGSGAHDPPAPRSPRAWRPCRRRPSPGHETRPASWSARRASVASLGTYASRAALAAATSPVMNRALARSRPLASAFEGSVEPSLRNGRRPRDLASRPPLALLDGDIGHRPTDPPSVGISDRDGGQDDERDDHPGRPRHGLEDAGQPGDGDHGDREDRARRDVTISWAGVPDRTSAR